MTIKRTDTTPTTRRTVDPVSTEAILFAPQPGKPNPTRRSTESRKPQPRWRDEDMPLRPGDVLAVGLDNGRCPVGMVTGVDDHYLRLDLYSWITRTFSAGVAVVRHGQVRDLSPLAAQDGDGVYLMEPLRQFQTAWEANR